MNNTDLELIPASRQGALQNIRNFLAGRFIGATRDRALMEEMFKCAFAKHWLKKEPGLAKGADISRSYRNAFVQVKESINGLFQPEAEIELDPAALHFIDQQLEAIDFEHARADVFGEIYETFAGAGDKANEGQFFTPAVAVDLLVDFVRPKPGSIVCDPAGGAGGFMIATARHWDALGTPPAAIAKGLFAVEKDAYLARIMRGRLALFLDTTPRVVCGDSLAGVTNDSNEFSFPECDVVLTNPPFGSKIVAANYQTLSKYDLAKKWVRTEEGGFSTAGGLNSPSPQILFLELCLRVLKPGGILGAILPESLVSSKSYHYVVHYLRERADVLAVVGMPEALFKTSGKSGTHTKTVALVAQRKPHPSRTKAVFFAEAKWCGHDSRARKVPLNDIPVIREHYEEFRSGRPCQHGPRGVSVPADRVGINLAPRAFEFNAQVEAEQIKTTHEVVRIRDLVQKGVITVSTGDEVGKLAYGTGDIPFIRTSDISTWEIKVDPKHKVSQQIFEKYRQSQDVRPRDILLVRDGTYLIGTCAIVSEQDIPMLYQSHIYKIRVVDVKKLDPYLFLAAISSPFVQRQIKSFCVSQDIIDSLGDKLYEIQIAVPKSKKRRDEIAHIVEEVITTRVQAREKAREAVAKIMAS
jgi:type I restriction enzyme M protein